MKIQFHWGKDKPKRTVKAKGRTGKGDHNCGCGAPIPAGVRSCGRCKRAGETSGRSGRRSIPNGTHQCPDGKTRQTRQGICPGPYC